MVDTGSSAFDAKNRLVIPSNHNHLNRYPPAQGRAQRQRHLWGLKTLAGRGQMKDRNLQTVMKRQTTSN